jgi:PAS domain-containing protein
MLEPLKSFFTSNSFVPHGHCYLWKPQLVGLHIVSDSLIALAYYSIPIMLIYFVHKRRDAPFQWIFLMFGAFIIACGTSHLMAVWTLWHPDYWLSGGIKLITAFISLYTAGELFILIPQALALPSPAQLEAANQKLAQEISASEAAVRHCIWAEEALKQSETRFRLIFENAAIGIVLADITGQLVATEPGIPTNAGLQPK